MTLSLIVAVLVVFVIVGGVIYPISRLIWRLKKHPFQAPVEIQDSVQTLDEHLDRFHTITTLMTDEYTRWKDTSPQLRQKIMEAEAQAALSPRRRLEDRGLPHQRPAAGG